MIPLPQLEFCKKIGGYHLSFSTQWTSPSAIHSSSYEYQGRLEGEEQLLIGIVLECWRLGIAIDHLTCYRNNGSQYYRWTNATKTNITYQFEFPLGDCISQNSNIYVCLTTTTLSRRLTMHLSDTSSITQHLKKHSCPPTRFRKILTKNTTI